MQHALPVCPKAREEILMPRARNIPEKSPAIVSKTMSDNTEPEKQNEPKHAAENGTATQEAAAKLESFIEEAAAHCQEAGRFLGLHKRASLVAAAVALCAVLAICAAIGNADKLAAEQAAVEQTPLIKEEQMQNVGTAVASTTEACTSAAKTQLVAQSLTPAALNAAPAAADTPTTFSLVEGADVAALSEEETANLVNALSQFTGNGYTVGCTLINLNTGKGVAYNLDSRVYGASSFKGPYAAYLCQHLGDNDAAYPAGAEAAGSGVSSSINSLMVPMVVNSDNNAFSSLRNSYDSSGFAEWLTACGVDSSIMHDTHFPRYSARESALLWLRTYQYLQTGTPTAQHLASLYTQTNVSFIRQGIGGVEGVETVRNKAGWCASGARFTGLCDAGLIECADGTTYLMSTMSNAPDSGTYTLRLANLANALFDCRDALS